MPTVFSRTSDNILALLATVVHKSGDTMSGDLTLNDAGVRAGSVGDFLNSALEVLRNGVQVGRIDNNSNGLRVQAQAGTLQLRGSGNTGMSVDSAGVVNFDETPTVDGVALTGGGWWKVPLMPINTGIDLKGTTPFIISNEVMPFNRITAPMFLPGPATYDQILTRVGTAGAAGSVGKVYKQNHTPDVLPNRATATFHVDIPVDVTNRSEVSMTSNPLVVPAEGVWLWFESTSSATVRAGKPILANVNWSSSGSIDAGGMPIGGATGSNTDLGYGYVPVLFFRRSA